MTTTVGFTGTRNGMTPKQRESVKQLLITLNPKCAVHGDCIGADADFDAICESLGIARSSRPCTLTNMRAHTGAREIAPPKHPMVRNSEIVADSCHMIGCPNGFERIKKGSGTWATIGMAEKAGVPLTIVFPDGSFAPTSPSQP